MGQSADAELGARFHQAMLAIYEKAKNECGGYRATYFLRMVQEHGGVQAARKLLAGPQAQEGLFKLWDCRRLDISMEALVLAPEWRPLLSEQERAIARKRLEQLGYTPSA